VSHLRFFQQQSVTERNFSPMAQLDNAFDDVGNGPPIIFLHGFPFNRSMWRGQIAFLSASGYRCIAPDLRGLGDNVDARLSDDVRSSAFRRPALIVTPPEGGTPNLHAGDVSTMDDMARDVAALMDRLSIERAVVCGLSMGCYAAFELIHLFPARVSALVLCGPRAQGPDEVEKKSREAQALRVLAEGMDFAVESISTMLLAQKTVNEKPEVLETVRHMVLHTDPRGAAAAQRGMSIRRDYSGDLANISVPTLIVAGREDGVRKPGDAEFIHSGIKNSHLEVIESAGHLMNMEEADAFNHAMLDFLTRNSLN
jgi:3-oxoadipate enol-lactonase